MLPRFLERSGQSAKGSITGFYTVLVEADDMNEPISDAVRSIVDGHVWLSRRLAARAHYPSISVLDSVSRLMSEVAQPQQKAAAKKIIRLMAVYKDAEDLINIGAYVRGSSPLIDQAIKHMPAIERFLRQDINEIFTLKEAADEVVRIASEIEDEAPPQQQSAGKAE
jgi:flagellum-specific ATP synthase